MKSMTYGTLPPFAEFSAHLDAARDEDDEPVWNDDGHPMELVGSAVEQAEDALRTCKGQESFHVAGFTGRHGKFGLRFTDKLSLWRFIEALPVFSDDDDGDLASSIMYTLGYEWV